MRRRFGLDGQTFATEEEAQSNDPFPCVLTPPIAHVDRVDRDSIDDAVAAEVEVEALVTSFGGAFAGT